MTQYKLVPVEPTPEMQTPSYMGPDGPDWPMRKAIYAAMLAAAPEVQAEPVAWELRKGKTDRVLLEITNDASRAHQWKCSLEEVVPLYTAPQPAKQPLTEEEIDAISDDHRDWTHQIGAFRNFARAIEAAHGIGSLCDSGMSNTDELTRDYVSEIELQRAKIERLEAERNELLETLKQISVRVESSMRLARVAIAKVEDKQ